MTKSSAVPRNWAIKYSNQRRPRARMIMVAAAMILESSMRELPQRVSRQEKDAWTYFSTIRVWGSTVGGS